MKRPAFQFYPGDWLRSTDLRSCSIAARGLWIDMLCLMHEGTPYGYLRVGNKDILPPILAKMVGESEENVIKWLKELSLAGVFSESQRSGTIFSRRMVRDEKTRESRAKGGSESLKNPNVPRPRISFPPSLTPSPASAFASALKTKPKTVAKVNGVHVELPDWIPLEHWHSFLAMRTKIKKPATPRAQRMLIGKLSELKDQGYNPMQVIAQAELNCWKSFYPPKEPQ